MEVYTKVMKIKIGRVNSQKLEKYCQKGDGKICIEFVLWKY